MISVASNFAPAEVVKMVALARANRMPEATALHAKLSGLFKNLFIEPNPVPVKYAMAKAGMIGSPEVRLPLCELADSSRTIIDQTVAALNA